MASSSHQADDAIDHRDAILTKMKAMNIRGTITLAPEGVNATISALDKDEMGHFMSFLHERLDVYGFQTPTFRESVHDDSHPFGKAKVKVKKELISLGVDGVNPAVCVGKYVDPTEWNDVISKPNTIMIDVRNSYEYDLGHFKGAVNPDTQNFKQMVGFTDSVLEASSVEHKGDCQDMCQRCSASDSAGADPEKSLHETKEPRTIAMYCTGGIRCEKFSSYLVSRGFDSVVHLKGGILAYLETVPEQRSLWEGKCYVFDERVTVEADALKKGAKAPVTPAAAVSHDS